MSLGFQLRDYYPDIRAAMETHDWTAANAVKRFITNLATLKPMYPADEWNHLSFNQLGQQWNRLGYQVRNDQQADAVTFLQSPVKRVRKRTSDDE